MRKMFLCQTKKTHVSRIHKPGPPWIGAHTERLSLIKPTFQQSERSTADPRGLRRRPTPDPQGPRRGQQLTPQGPRRRPTAGTPHRPVRWPQLQHSLWSSGHFLLSSVLTMTLREGCNRGIAASVPTGVQPPPWGPRGQSPKE